MPAARICTLSDVADRLPADCFLRQGLGGEAGAELAAERVLHIQGDAALPHLHLNAALVSGSPLHTLLAGGDAAVAAATAAPPGPPYLILVEGHLDIAAALTADASGAVPHLIVLGAARAGNAALCGALVQVQQGLEVRGLLWGDDNHGELRVHGGLRARVALFTDGFPVHVAGPEEVEFLMDEVRGVPHRAEFSSEIMGAVFPAEFHDGIDAGEDGLARMLDRGRIVAALRAGGDAVRTSAEIHARLPLASDLCPDGAISVANILALVGTPVVAHKEHVASGWFQQTDFSICQRHVDEDGDQRDDNVFITVWKTWDFYLAVDQAPVRQGWGARLAAAVLRRPVPATPELTLLYRAYAHGEAGEWKALAQDAAPEAWAACRKAWRGVLDYVRKAVAQHRARYPLYQQLQAELTAAQIEEFTNLPVFTERYNDWWDSDRNGHWQGDVWVGARQPCMHEGEPWGRALKLSWENGEPAAGDDADNAHSAYQIEVDEARDGPALVGFTYAQRQSDARVPLPRGAADHIARLLRFYGLVQGRLRAEHAQQQASEAEARRIAAAVHLLAAPPLAPDLADAAVFPPELLALSDQWQTGGQAYVAAIREHQRALDGPGAEERDQTTGDEVEQDALPSDPRKDDAPTVLQLARLVNTHADADLARRFRQRFAFAPDAFVRHAAHGGTFVGPVIALEDGRVLARVGAPYDDAAYWVALEGLKHAPLPWLHGLGRSLDRRIFARSDGQQITTHHGFEGPVIARFALPRGDEGLPPHVEVGPGALGQRCDEIIPFNDGRRVLLRNPTGIYLLASAAGSSCVQRLHPQTFDEDGPYTWPKNQMEEEADGETRTVLALDMLHMALSPDERYIAVGDQDSGHILLRAQDGAVAAERDPASSYPHHAAFSHDGTRLFANSCHLYAGATLSLPHPPGTVGDSADDAAALLEDSCRVYASATLPGMVIVGDADGYLHALRDDGQPLWRHHIGSTISALEASPDGDTLWAASYGGYLVRLSRAETGMDPYSIGTSPYVETLRWIFWDDEPGPLCW